MAKQSESSDVGCAPRANRECRSTRFAIEFFHPLQHHALWLRRKLTSLGCRRENSVSDWFCEHELVTCFGTGVGEKKIGVCASRHSQAVLQLGVNDCVSANDESTSFVQFLLSARKNCGQYVERQILGWKCDDVHRGKRLTTHCVDIGQGIRSGDLAEIERVVHNGREKIHRLHEGEIVGQPKDPGVVEGLATYQQAGIVL